MKTTLKKRSQRKGASGRAKSRELEGQLANGRKFMKEYAETFRGLARRTRANPSG